MISVFHGLENVVEKRRKCWFPAFSSFLTVFLKALCFSLTKTRDCVVKSQKAMICETGAIYNVSAKKGLMIVIVTGFIPLSLLSVVWTMVMRESSQWLGKNIVQSTG